MELVGLDQIKQARERVEGIAVRTPLEYSRILSSICGGDVHLKCENLQRTGAFKIRGAYNRLSQLSEEQRAAGVVAASAGNHAQGVALAASLLGIRSTVFMAEGAALPKVEATRNYGAEVLLEGEDYEAAYSAAVAFSQRTGAVIVHPFDHPDIIAGQGTVALEIMEQLKDAASIIVPVGGGGLISGIAAAAKALNPQIRIIGVEPDGAAGISAGLSAGEAVELPSISTVADGLAAKRAGEITLEHIRRLVDEVVVVSDDHIAQALLLITERAKLVVEPSGAAGVAALISKMCKPVFPAVVLLSGGNIDPLLLMKVIRFGMGSAGRYYSFRTRISDRPGELHRLLGVIADAGGNVVGVEHHREGVILKHLGDVEIAVQVETRGQDHVSALEEEISAAGYAVERL